ncbi:hypothetical protein [Elizabethkingia occulta]|nr:hypothetical protein [Elizabethkingia occulta]
MKQLQYPILSFISSLTGTGRILLPQFSGYNSLKYSVICSIQKPQDYRN